MLLTFHIEKLKILYFVFKLFLIYVITDRTHETSYILLSIPVTKAPINTGTLIHEYTREK
jgi:hypothetical protein